MTGAPSPKVQNLALAVASAEAQARSLSAPHPFANLTTGQTLGNAFTAATKAFREYRARLRDWREAIRPKTAADRAALARAEERRARRRAHNLYIVSRGGMKGV